MILKTDVTDQHGIQLLADGSAAFEQVLERPWQTRLDRLAMVIGLFTVEACVVYTTPAVDIGFTRSAAKEWNRRVEDCRVQADSSFAAVCGSRATDHCAHAIGGGGARPEGRKKFGGRAKPGHALIVDGTGISTHTSIFRITFGIKGTGSLHTGTILTVVAVIANTAGLPADGVETTYKVRAIGYAGALNQTLAVAKNQAFLANEFSIDALSPIRNLFPTFAAIIRIGIQVIASTWASSEGGVVTNNLSVDASLTLDKIYAA